MSLNKNGNILSNNLYEADAMSFSAPTISYTPTKDKINSCMGTRINGDFEINKQYYVECLVTWKDFDASSTEGTFSINLQGSQYTDEKGWAWFANNYVANSLNTACGGLKSLVLGSTSGSKLVSATFTNKTCTGYEIGCRTDYSNGKGWIQLSNLKVCPLEYAITSSTSLHIANDFISTGNFIEY